MKTGKFKYIRTECPYKVYVKKDSSRPDSSNKWIITKTPLHCQEHNHQPIPEDDKILFHQYREFSSDDIKFIQEKYIDGFTPSKIHSDLSEEYRKTGKKLLAIPSDYHNLFAKSTIEEDLEKILQNPKSLDPYLVVQYNKADNVIDWIFLYFDDYLVANRNYVEVMGLDSTHNTNYYNYKLVLSTCVDNNGKTGILTAGLFKHETRESYDKYLTASTKAIGIIEFIKKHVKIFY